MCPYITCLVVQYVFFESGGMGSIPRLIMLFYRTPESATPSNFCRPATPTGSLLFAAPRPERPSDPANPAKRQVAQTIAGTYPGNTLKFNYSHLLKCVTVPYVTMQTSLRYTFNVSA